MPFRGSILFELVCLVGARESLQLIPFISLAGLFDYPHMDHVKTIWGKFTSFVFATKTCWDTQILELISKQGERTHHFYFRAKKKKNQLCKSQNEKNSFQDTCNVILLKAIWLLQFDSCVSFNSLLVGLQNISLLIFHLLIFNQTNASLQNICLFFDISIISHVTNDKRNIFIPLKKSCIHSYINMHILSHI